MLTDLENKLESLNVWVAFLAISGLLTALFLKFILGSSESWVLITVLIIGGLAIVTQQILNIIRLHFSSDILAAISICTAIILGEYWAAVLVVLMLSGGKSLESFAGTRASRAISAFLQRLPNKVKKVSGETLTDVDVKDFELHDLFILEPHQVSVFDGIVEKGKSSVDESLLTGEAFRVSKMKGSKIVSGSLNGNNALTVRVSAIGQDTRYQKIIEIMKEAQNKKLRLRRIGDGLGALYTPFALSLAFYFQQVSGSWEIFLSVLVVATPCPLLIGIPVAIIGAVSKGAENGILIKDPSILEKIEKIQSVFLDKTGTITYGEPRVTEVLELGNKSKEDLIPLIAGLEQFSTHPFAKPILEYASLMNIGPKTPDSCEDKAGVGLKGYYGSDEIIVTSRRKASLILKNQKLPEQSDGLEAIIIFNSEPVLLIRLKDEIKEGGRKFIKHLKSSHNVKKISILSGDTLKEVRNVAEQVGISDLKAQLSPEEKYQIVKAESENHLTLFVGDGINDAPALSVATVGVAFRAASDISAEAASVVILDGSLKKLDQLIHLGKNTRKIALQSAIGGITLSVVGMFFAGFGYLSPVSGAIFQEAIDVFAILNALRTCLPSHLESDFN